MNFLDQLLEKDTELFLYLNNLGTEPWDGFWMFVTNKESWIPFYVLMLLFAIWRFKNWRKILLLVLSVSLLILIVDQSTSSFFKPVIGRFRPCHNELLDGLMRLVKEGCGGKYAFFSSHSSNSFALATFFGLTMTGLRKYILPVLLFWAAMVAYSRVYIGVHYPLDIFAGMLWGILWGILIYKLFKLLAGKATHAKD